MPTTVKRSPEGTSTTEDSPLLGPKNDTMSNAAMPNHGSASPGSTYGMPQTIGHRGFKAAAPENTMAAFKAAAEAGVDAIETDLHLTRDGVVVLCHDETLLRCYGNKAKVRDLDWSEISQLRTLLEPHEPMPRLVDLLEYLGQPGLEDVGLLLDVKTHDDAEDIMKRTAAALDEVTSKQPWETRVTPCCWDAKYIKLSMKYLPTYPITHVGFSTTYARCLVDIPNISFSMLRHTIASPFGLRFLRDMKKLGIPVHVWTVNEESWMEWSIRKEVSGVITDEVALFHKVCDRMGDLDGKSGKRAAGLKSFSLFQFVRFWAEIALFQFLVTAYMARERWRHGSPEHRVNKALNA
ncbi:PLC-like phosphodiesterase [Astrocystis sublimbata]|nr:PLC-like phosphodiesterase [Astrocystis sublimbata]